jgi:hypothetical protein
MRKRLIPLIALLMILAIVAVAYSVAIGLESTDIDQLGATSKVEVYCPVSGTPCKIDRVKWVITGPPYMVDQVKVKWTPVSSSGSYTVYVELYDSGNTLLAYGSATQSGSGTPVITEVDVDTPSGGETVDPKDVGRVRIVIVQD